MRRTFSLERIWNVFTVWWFDLSGEYLTLSFKGYYGWLILQRNDLLNYLIILGKLTIWECRKNKVEVKKQVEKIIAIRNRKLRDFQIRWDFLILFCVCPFLQGKEWKTNAQI